MLESFIDRLGFAEFDPLGWFVVGEYESEITGCITATFAGKVLGVLPPFFVNVEIYKDCWRSE